MSDGNGSGEAAPEKKPFLAGFMPGYDLPEDSRIDVLKERIIEWAQKAGANLETQVFPLFSKYRELLLEQEIAWNERLDRNLAWAAKYAQAAGKDQLFQQWVDQSSLTDDQKAELLRVVDAELSAQESTFNEEMWQKRMNGDYAHDEASEPEGVEIDLAAEGKAIAALLEIVHHLPQQSHERVLKTVCSLVLPPEPVSRLGLLAQQSGLLGD